VDNFLCDNRKKHRSLGRRQRRAGKDSTSHDLPIEQDESFYPIHI
jgi:hypothetical protein